MPVGSTVVAGDSYNPGLYVGSDKKLHGLFLDQANSASDLLTSTGTVTDNKWHQAVLAATGTTETLYLDGTQQATESKGTLQYNGGAYVYLGAGTIGSAWANAPAADSTSTSHFNGSLAEAAYYDTALTQAAVTVHYQAMATAASPTPVTTTTVTDPGGNTLTSRYDTGNGGRPLSSTDAYGNTTSYTYDAGGFLHTITDPDGHTTTLGHDADGNTVSTTTCRNPGNCQTSYATYYINTLNALDPQNDEKLTSSDARSSDAGDINYRTQYQYDSAGNLTLTSPPRASATQYYYTAGTESAVGGGTEPPGLFARKTDAGGHTTSYSYYSNGNLASTTSPSGLVTSYPSYDGIGRVTQKTVTCSNCGSGQSSMVTTYSWDGQSNLVTETDPATTDAVTGVTHTPQTTYVYDLDGDQLSRTVSDVTGGDTARATTWTYNANNDLVQSVKDPAGRVTAYAYDNYGNVTGGTDPAGTQYSYSYSPMGQLQSAAITNYTGNPNNPVPAHWLTIDSRAYDPAGRLATDTDAMGRTTHTYYNDDNTVAEVDLDGFHNSDGTLRNVVEESDSYDAAGNLISQTKGGGKVTTALGYDSEGLLTTTTIDPAGLDRTSTINYNPDDTTASVIKSGAGTSQETDYLYDSLGNVTSTTVKDPTGDHTTTINRDQRGLPTSSVAADGNVTGATAANYTTYFTYDAAGELTTTIAPPVTVEIYNPSTNSSTAAQQTPITYTGYDTFGDATSTEDPQGTITSSGTQANITTTTYDQDGEPVAIASPAYTDPHTGTVLHPVGTASYDALGRLQSTTEDPSGLNLTTSRTYDQLGNPAKVTAPQLNNQPVVQTYNYDLDGEQLSATSPTGAVTEATYDDLGRKITSTAIERYPSSQAYTTAYTWDDAGNQLTATEPGTGITSAKYDAAGEPTSTTDANQLTTSAIYDGFGQATTVTQPDGTKTSTAYNVLGEPLTVSHIDTTGATSGTVYYGYDAAGNRTSSTDNVANPTDQAAHTTTYTLDALGRITQQVEPVAAGTSITSSFGYDADGNRTRFTNGKNIATYYTYNSLKLPESTIEPPTTAYPNPADGTFTTSYDTLARPTTLVEPGGAVRQSTYDALGNLTGETATGGGTSTLARSLAYDVAGNLTSVGTPSGTADTYTYDDRGHLLKSTGPSGTSAYSYDGDGNMLSRTDAAGTTGFSYDTGNRLTSATDPLTGKTLSYTYNTVGQLQTEQYGTGGDTRNYAYDTLGRLQSDTVKNTTGNPLASITYGYNPDGQITSENTTGTAGAGNNTFTYDLAGRITSWNNGAATTNYTWDAAGNRTSAGNQSATYDARNELLTNGTTSYAYTARGTLNTITPQSGNPTAVQYDGFDRMTADGSVTYTYDSLDRIAQTAGTTFTYDGGSNNLVTDTLYAYSRLPDGSLIGTANQSAGTISNPTLSITDQHDNVVADLTPTANTLSSSIAYDPFGQPTASNGTNSNLGYQSGWTDPATGLVNMHARWYQPSSGTFTSRDSWTLSPHPKSTNGNRYTYAGGDPLDGIDPSGHDVSPAECMRIPIEYGPEAGELEALCLIFDTNGGTARLGPIPGGGSGPGDTNLLSHICLTNPWLQQCGGNGGVMANFNGGGGNGNVGGGGGGGGGGGCYISCGPKFDPNPINKRPHIHDTNPIDWLEKELTHVGKAIIGGAATGAAAFAGAALAGADTLTAALVDTMFNEIIDFNFSNDPAPEPTPVPSPEPDPGPNSRPGGDGVVDTRHPTCLNSRPSGAENLGKSGGWVLYSYNNGRPGLMTACVVTPLAGHPTDAARPIGWKDAQATATAAGAMTGSVASCHSLGPSSGDPTRTRLICPRVGKLRRTPLVLACRTSKVRSAWLPMADKRSSILSTLDISRIPTRCHTATTWNTTEPTWTVGLAHRTPS